MCGKHVFVSHQENSLLMILLQKRAHDAGVESTERVGNKDWWRNIPPPVTTRRSTKRENYDTANYNFQTEGRFVSY